MCEISIGSQEGHRDLLKLAEENNGVNPLGWKIVMQSSRELCGLFTFLFGGLRVSVGRFGLLAIVSSGEVLSFGSEH